MFDLCFIMMTVIPSNPIRNARSNIFEERNRNYTIIIYKAKDKFDFIINRQLIFNMIFIDLVTSNKHM